MDTPIYLDYNATTPVDQQVVEAMLPYFREEFGNAASHTHLYGDKARKAVEKARQQVANLIGADPKEIVFTSGATEAINLAIKGTYEQYKKKGQHIITVQTEHKAVLDTCEYLESKGAKVTYLPVDKEGLLDLNQLEDAIRDDTIMIAVMWANNETGVLQDILTISQIALKHEIPFFTDATQSAGKIPVDSGHEGTSLMAFSGHKMYGPKGIGALYVDKNTEVTPQIHGGGHENGVRSGTLNVPAIVGFGKACELCRDKLPEGAKRLSQLRDNLENALLEQGNVNVNGSREKRLPNTSNLCFEGIDADELIMMTRKDIAVATGSACTSEVIEPSHVLKAMNFKENRIKSSLRLSIGRFSSKEDISKSRDLLKSKLMVLEPNKLRP